jgi:N-acetylglucosamine repressor
LLRQLNERQVLAALQRRGPLSRAEICRLTGISGPTVTRVVASLLDNQLVEEEEPQHKAIGRPGKIVRLARTNTSVIGCVVGPLQSEVALCGLDGNVATADVRHFPTPATYEVLVSTFVSTVRSLMEQRKTTMLGVGVSVPGLINRREGQSLVSPNVHQLDGRNLGDDLRERLQLDTVVVQECHALCLAEQVYGEARGVADFAMLDVSEGLGLGVVQGGRMLQGHSGLGGELGHVTVQLDGRRCGCGNHGCLETVATDAALVARVAERIGRPLDIDTLLSEVRRGALDVREEVSGVLDYLAVGVAAVINIFNPHKLFIYGKFLDLDSSFFDGAWFDGSLFDELLKRTARRALEPNLRDCQIIRARGNKRLGAIAAAIHGATHGWSEAVT